MEITNDIKAKVFAQYLGQKYNDGDLEEPQIFPVEAETFSCFELYPNGMNSAKLILKPLSAITDEDAIEVARILGYHPTQEKGTIGRRFANSFSEVWHSQKPFDLLCAFQYLQSKGYDLPSYLLGGKTLHEAGLAIYEPIVTDS